jgi:O-Antigen ligase
MDKIESARFRLAVIASLYALIGISLLVLAMASGWILPRPGGYVAYSVLLVAFAVGVVRPFVGVLSAFALLPVSFGIAVPHTISSAPSDYFIAGACFGFLLQGRCFTDSLKPFPWAAGVGALAIFGAAAASLLASLLMAQGPSVDLKFQIAELGGVFTMALYLLGPVMLLRQIPDPKPLLIAAGAGLIPIMLGLALGGPNTLLCFAEDSKWLFTTAGFRTNGLSGDPNLFGVAAATWIPLSIVATAQVSERRAWFVLIPMILIVLGIILSGSRSGFVVAAFVLLFSAWFLRKYYTWPVGTSICVAAALLAVAPIFWKTLPCLNDRSSDSLYFGERNDQATYLTRLEVEKWSALKNGELASLSPELLSAVRSCSSEEPSGRTIIKSASLECLIRQVRNAHSSSEPSITGYRQSPLNSFISKLPVDPTRRSLWDHAVAVGSDRPILGVGLAKLSAVTPFGWRAHNTPLTVFAEQGVVGVIALGVSTFLALAAGLMGALRSDSYRHFYAALLIATIGLLLSSLTQDMMRNGLLWGFLGLLLTAPLVRPSLNTVE